MTSLSVALATLPACDSSKSDDDSSDAKGKSSKKKKKKKKKKACNSFASCQKACDGNDAKACVKLGDEHRTEPHGSDGKWDKEAAIAAYDKGCKGKDQLGCAKHAAMTQYKLKSSYDLAKKACDKGVDLGCAISGQILAKGREFDDGGKVEKDNAAGLAVLTKHCDKNEPMACSSLAYYHFWNFDDKQETKARELWTKACDKDELQACFALGAWGDKSEDETFKLLGKACDGGLAGGFIGGDNSCRVEAERQIKWLTSTLVKAYVEAGEPSSATETAAFRETMKKNKPYQERKARLQKITKKACNMGSEDACKILADDDNKTWFAEDK